MKFLFTRLFCLSLLALSALSFSATSIDASNDCSLLCEALFGDEYKKGNCSSLCAQYKKALKKNGKSTDAVFICRAMEFRMKAADENWSWDDSLVANRGQCVSQAVAALKD